MIHMTSSGSCSDVEFERRLLSWIAAYPMQVDVLRIAGSTNMFFSGICGACSRTNPVYSWFVATKISFGSRKLRRSTVC